MILEKVYLLLLLLPQIITQGEGSCVINNYEGPFIVDFKLYKSWAGTYCTYDTIHNPHQFNLVPAYNNNSVLFSVEVTIQSSLIPKIQSSTFTSTSTITLLSIENGKISDIEDGAFGDFGALGSLTLRSNNFTILRNNTFSSLVHLRRLELPLNGIIVLETGAFTQLMKLETLDLSLNSIFNVNKVFHSLNNLREINLSRNKIVTVENGAFTDLKQLKLIDLSNNRIQKMDSQAFKGLPSIDTIYLNDNNVTELNGFEEHKNLIGWDYQRKKNAFHRFKYLNISQNHNIEDLIEVFTNAILSNINESKTEISNKLEEVIDLFKGGNKSREEYFSELIMIVKNISIPQNEKTTNYNCENFVQYYLYILSVIIIIIMLGMFVMIFIYLRCKHNEKKSLVGNAQATHFSEYPTSAGF